MFVSEEDKKTTAYHEIGHALVALLTEGATPVHKVTILPRGGALGFTATVPEKDDLHLTKKSIMASIDVAMGGRAAEQIFFGNEQISTGCSSDLKAATRYAYYFVGKLGMKEDINLASPTDEMVLSEEYKTGIDQEVNKILKDSYNRVKDLLKQNRSNVDLLVKELVQHETLNIEQIKKLLKIA